MSDTLINPDYAVANVITSKRARAVGIIGDQWPYGPNIDPVARVKMVAWAEKNGLRLTWPKHRCLHWLRSGRCNVGHCDYVKNTSDPRYVWMDHVSCWNRDGRPAMLVCQPYGVSETDRLILDDIALAYDIDVQIGPTGWYGHNTTFITLTRRSTV